MSRITSVLWAEVWVPNRCLFGRSGAGCTCEVFGNEPDAVNLWIGDGRAVSSCHKACAPRTVACRLVLG
eukprot:2134676-Amphidinium_carterae.1